MPQLLPAASFPIHCSSVILPSDTNSLRYWQHHLINHKEFSEGKGLNSNKKVRKLQTYPKHTSKLWMLTVLNLFHSGHKQPHDDLNDMTCQVMISVTQSQLKLTVLKFWICFLNMVSVMMAREIIMAEETFSCTLCRFVQPVLCLQINCRTNNIEWNKRWGTAFLSQVVSGNYRGFCLDVCGCWHTYKHVMTLISASERR
jgi:hypothetical protein